MIGYKKEVHATSLGLTIDLHLEVLDDYISYRYGNKEGSLSLRKLNRDPSSNQPIDEPHSIIGVGFRYDTTPFVFDFFRYSYPTKTTTGHVVTSMLGIEQGFYFARPWKDTPLNDWKVFASAKDIFINGVKQENTIKTINGNGLTDVINWLPTIKMSLQDDKIMVQLLEGKENINIYLETDTGILENTKLTTDSKGYAETKILFANKGTVSAGFKHYNKKVTLCLQ